MIQGLRSMPVFPVNDMGKAIDFYTDGLGFTLAGVMRNADGSDRFAIVKLDHITIGLQVSERKGSGSDWAGYFFLQDISTFVDQVQGNGVRVVRGPEESHYYCIEVEVTDPSENLLCFAQDKRPGPDGPGL